MVNISTDDELDNDAIVQYTAPHLFNVPQDILPSDDGNFLLLVCTNKSRLDALLSALLDYSYWANVPHVYEHSFDVVNALANVYFIDGLDCTDMELCQLIADCITNNDGTQNAIADLFNSSSVFQNAVDQYLQENGYGSGDGNAASPATYLNNPLLADGSLITGCDNDSLFGAVTQLVDLMDTIITDAFEGFEAQTEGAERWATVLEAIPITNILAIDDLIQFADQLLENVAQSYAAEYTAQLRDDFRCDLFCLVKDTCELDFQTWADYFMNLLGQSIVDNAFSNAIAWFTGGNFSNEEIVYAAHAIVCQILAHGSKFFGIDPVWLGKAVTAAMNDPDSDWTIICDDCLPVVALPILDPAPAVGGGTGGTNLTDLGGGTWIATSTARASDAAVAIKADDDGLFRITSQSRSTGSGHYYGYERPDGSIQVGAGNPPLNTDFRSLIWTWGSGQVGATVTFNFVEA